MNDDRDTRPSLLVKIRDPRNQESWSQFVELYGPLILRCLRSMGVPEQDALDLSQDVLRILIRRMQTFEY